MAILAEELVKQLAARGVKHVFGIPGGPSIPYLDAMRKQGIEFVLVSNEQSAGMMADVTGRLTGVPGICHATFGPGATNLATGVGGALLDRSPLIAFTTEVKAADIGRKVQMNIDHQALFRPITKWTTRLSAPAFGPTIAKAFAVAKAELPGPVHIGLPSDIDGAFVTATDAGGAATAVPIVAAAEAWRTAEAWLRQAKRPLLAVGLTAARCRQQAAIRHFAERHGIPAVLTPMAKGVLPAEHPCHAGVLFHACSELVAEVHRQADLIVGIGYDPIEFNYEAWMPPVPLLHFDSEPADITPEYAAVCNVAGDLPSALARLAELDLPVYGWDLSLISRNRDRLRRALQPASEHCGPAEILGALREVLPPDGILTADVGAHLHLLGQLWSVDEPNQFLMSNGWSTMGFGIPSAIGAKLCRPDKAVVCVTGDGGFLMNCGELMTARRLGLNVVVVVLCDRNLSLIEVKQGWKNVPQYGTTVCDGEYFGAAAFLGVPVLPVHNAAEMRRSLQTALAMPGPAIVAAVVDGSDYKNLIARSYK